MEGAGDAVRMREEEGWGGVWSALWEDVVADDDGIGCRMQKNPRASVGYSGIVRICQDAHQSLCDVGPRVDGGRKPAYGREGGMDSWREGGREDGCTSPPRHSDSLSGGGERGAGGGGVGGGDGMRVGRRVMLSTSVCVYMAMVLRKLLGHTRMHALVHAYGSGGGGDGTGAGAERGCVRDACGWQYACIEEEAEVALRLMVARAEADLNEEVLLVARATVDSATRAAALWQRTLSASGNVDVSLASADPLPTALQVYFGTTSP